MKLPGITAWQPLGLDRLGQLPGITAWRPLGLDRLGELPGITACRPLGWDRFGGIIFDGGEPGGEIPRPDKSSSGGILKRVVDGNLRVSDVNFLREPAGPVGGEWFWLDWLAEILFAAVTLGADAFEGPDGADGAAGRGRLGRGWV